ncbi:MAG: PPOX class F420-dependent oxidoreductase, partial [Gordonia amarae]
MAENIFDPRDLIAATKIGILATLKSSGLPQL